MAGDCGLNALSLLPENVLPQWQQKIALRAENPSGHTDIMIWSRRIFCAAIFCRYWTCSFSRRNNQAIRAEGVCIFTLLLYSDNSY